MKVKEVLISFNKINYRDGEDEESKTKTKVIVASDKQLTKSRYYFNHNPTSFYCLNLPNVVNGNINLYEGGRHATGLETKSGVRCTDLIFQDEPSFSDGKLEFSTFDSLLYYIMNKSSSIEQSGGPFELKFNTDVPTRTFVNIDGEFYKAYDLVNIRILKGESICKNGQARLLSNNRNAIFD